MIEFYPQARAVHIGAVLCSGTLFALRGGGVLAGARWPMAAPLRYFSYSIDTVLLTAALVLVAMLPSAVFANHWLTLKLVLLLVYVALGSLALKRGRSVRVRALCFVAALTVFAAMVGIARAHQPFGWLAGSADTRVGRPTGAINVNNNSGALQLVGVLRWAQAAQAVVQRVRLAVRIGWRTSVPAFQPGRGHLDAVGHAAGGGQMAQHAFGRGAAADIAGADEDDAPGHRERTVARQYVSSR